MRYAMVLNDGETFTNLEGCAIVAFPDDFDIEAIEEALDADDGTNYICEFLVQSGGVIEATDPAGVVLMSHRPLP